MALLVLTCLDERGSPRLRLANREAHESVDIRPWRQTAGEFA